jgi:hypothetical protein
MIVAGLPIGKGIPHRVPIHRAQLWRQRFDFRALVHAACHAA